MWLLVMVYHNYLLTSSEIIGREYFCISCLLIFSWLSYWRQDRCTGTDVATLGQITVHLWKASIEMKEKTLLKAGVYRCNTTLHIIVYKQLYEVKLDFGEQHKNIAATCGFFTYERNTLFKRK